MEVVGRAGIWLRGGGGLWPEGGDGDYLAGSLWGFGRSGVGGPRPDQSPLIAHGQLVRSAAKLAD